MMTFDILQTFPLSKGARFIFKWISIFSDTTQIVESSQIRSFESIHKEKKESRATIIHKSMLGKYE